ncbi:unnamed protein product, partial [Symbiodinium sp. CCMP2456]
VKGNGDLVAIQTGPRTESKKTEVTVLSAASKYQRISLKTKTPLSLTLPIHIRFLVNWRGDLVCVYRGAGTGSGRTEVHVVSARSRYRRWVLHTATALHYTNSDRWEFGLRGNGDIVGILRKEPTGTKMTEVHILSARNRYRSFALHAGTAHPYAPHGVQFAVADSGDVLAVHEGPGIGLGNGRPERVYIMTLASHYKEFAIGTPKFGATASSSCTSGGCDPPQTPDLAFDGNMKKFWNGCCRGYPNQWLQYKFDSPTRITGYGLTTGSGECPSAWVFEGSYDGSTFTRLDQHSGRGCSNYREQVYRLQNPSLQRIFRWRFSAGVGGNSNGMVLREVRFFTNEKDAKGATDCYAQRTLVADEGPGVGNTLHMASFEACQEECSSIGSCNSFAYCQGERGKFNCHYKSKIIGAHDAATTNQRLLKGCKSFYKTECKDTKEDSGDAKETKACYKERTLVADEGEPLGHLDGNPSLAKCEEQCASILGCNSFALCQPNSPTCYFKKKIISEKDPAAKHQAAKMCKTYYKVDCKEEKKQEEECYGERTLVANEGPGVGDRIGVDSIESCEDECSKIKGCESIAVCISPGHTQNCHYKSKKVTLDEAATSHPKKLKECKTLYKTKCKGGEKIIRFDNSGCATDK